MTTPRSEGPQASIILDIPAPPSVNQYRWRLGNRSPAVARWVTGVDRLLLSRRPRPVGVKGYFSIKIIFSNNFFLKSDLDNRIKPLLDYLQRIELIENDRFCTRLEASFGEAPDGCRVFIYPWRAEDGTGMSLREIHGIADAKESTILGEADQCEVVVTDQNKRVLLTIRAARVASMTAEQARFIAQRMMEAADRVEGKPI